MVAVTLPFSEPVLSLAQRVPARTRPNGTRKNLPGLVGLDALALDQIVHRPIRLVGCLASGGSWRIFADRVTDKCSANIVTAGGHPRSGIASRVEAERSGNIGR